MYDIFFGERTGSHIVAQAGFELMTLMPLPPECWYYRYEPLCPAGMMLLNHKSNDAVLHTTLL
jgi:hypothetical protein